MRQWKRNSDGLFVTTCVDCGKDKLTKKRPYEGTGRCLSCAAVISYEKKRDKVINPERNAKISEAKKRYWDKKSAEERRTLIGTWMKDTIESKVSSYEVEFADFLDTIQVEYKQQYWVGGYPFDFFLTESNQLVEIDGEYWHPLSEADCKNKMHFDHLKRDKKKNKVAKDHGYKLTRIRV